MQHMTSSHVAPHYRYDPYRPPPAEDAVRVAEVAAEIRQRGASVPPMTLAEINAWRAAFPHQVQVTGG